MDECTEWVYDQFGVDVGPWTIYRLLQRERYTYKVSAKFNRDRNSELRQHFYNRQRTLRADQVVAIDESAANERTAERRRGWALSGRECVGPYHTQRTPRWSVLPAMDVNGYFAWEILDGGYTQELFESFIVNQVLPQCNPWPGPRSVLVMDNASIHNIPRITAICEAQGVIVLQLPPYSPDYNPIKQSFQVLKA